MTIESLYCTMSVQSAIGQIFYSKPEDTNTDVGAIICHVAPSESMLRLDVHVFRSQQPLHIDALALETLDLSVWACGL